MCGSTGATSATASPRPASTSASSPFLDELPPERVARYGLRREERLFGREDVYLCTK